MATGLSNWEDSDDILIPEENLKNLVIERLALIIHGHNCFTEDYEVCTYYQCQLIKVVLKHMEFCFNAGVCSFPHCSTSCLILTHWNKCSHLNCFYCSYVEGKDLSCAKITICAPAAASSTSCSASLAPFEGSFFGTLKFIKTLNDIRLNPSLSVQEVEAKIQEVLDKMDEFPVQRDQMHEIFEACPFLLVLLRSPTETPPLRIL